jgi:Domain of unknown function (DUF4365)
MERPQSHITDTLGKAQMRAVFEPMGWTVNEIDDDYGVDYDVQLFENAKATGEWFKLQLKSSLNTVYAINRDFISEPLSRQHAVHFSAEMKDPIFVIHADLVERRTFWYAPQLDTPVSATDPRDEITIRIPTRNELPATLSDLVVNLQKIRIRIGAKIVAESTASDFVASVDNSRRGELIASFQNKVDVLRLDEIRDLANSGDLEAAATKVHSLSANTESSVETRFSAVMERERIDIMAARKTDAPQSELSTINLRAARRLQNLTRKGPPALKFFALIARKAAELGVLTFQDLGLYMGMKSHLHSGDQAIALHLSVESLRSTSRVVTKYNQCVRLVRYAANSRYRWALPTALIRIVASIVAFIGRLTDEGHTDSAKQYSASAFRICELAAWIAERNEDEAALSQVATMVMLLAYKNQGQDEIAKVITFARNTVNKIKDQNVSVRTSEALDKAIRRMSGEKIAGDPENDFVTRIAENRAFGLGLDMNDVSNPIVRAVRLGIKDYSAERAIKHCEHSFVSISGWKIPFSISMAAQLLQMPSMCGKIMHCTLHNYNVEGRTLDAVSEQFKTQYCDSCKDVAPRPIGWVYSDDWLEQENERREEFMAKFYEKRYKN